ncbi:MAG: hypothetical protein M3O00_05345 [Pseudomonadota bacterium]|nr:hypothetical protein [Pseudomonadota bacterium]
MAAAVPFKAIKAETKNKIIKDESRYVKLARKLSNIANRLSEDGKPSVRDINSMSKKRAINIESRYTAIKHPIVADIVPTLVDVFR